jgi:DNA-binding XRE family transcriptional regulator
MKDTETKERFIELRARGLSYDAIAKELALSKQTLINWSKELKIEIANLKSICLDTIFTQYYVYKDSRVKLLGETLEKLRIELEKRDISNIPTDKLLSLFIKYSEALRNEESNVMFQGTASPVEHMFEQNGMTQTTSWTA